MSADNGIYILTTKRKSHDCQDCLEYRVRELQAVENVDWDETKKNPERDYPGDYTEDNDVRIKNAREMWAGCEVFNTESEALAEAKRIYDETMNSDFPVLEYGICFIHIDREF